MSKKRILFVSEAGHALSGYGKYYKELISRLHATGKYELAELACCAEVSPREAKLASYVRWLYYPNSVNDTKDPRFKEYTSNPYNTKGMWRFEQVCLDFKPDIVVDIRDPWDFQYQLSSPLRPYFHLCWMPTVDSSPQKDLWLESFIRADSIFTYSDYGLDVLREEGFGKINLVAAAPSGVDLNAFKPMDKVALRQAFGLPEDALILGTVMRNQKRKLYPELIKAFRAFLERCKQEGNISLAGRAYLYFHVSFPDEGWDIPALVKESGFAHKILFTYYDRVVHKWFPSRFADMRQISPFTKEPTAFLPNVSSGPNEAQLAQIYNLFDAYVQYAICEGFGMPQVEAAACGVPVFATDYSAMSDIVRKVHGFPIRVQKMFRERETNAERAYPDNTDMAAKLYTFFSLLTEGRVALGKKAREGCEQHYDWDLTSLTWQAHFDNVTLRGLQGRWDAPYREHQSSFGLQGKIPPVLLLDELYRNVLGRPDLIGSYEYLTLMRDLTNETTTEGRGRIMKPEEVLKGFQRRAKFQREWEQARCGMIRLPEEDYVAFAHMMKGGR